MKGLTPLCREFARKGRSDDCPIYDMHGHMGPFRGIYLPFPEPEEMVGRMKRAGVLMLAFSSHSALSSPDAGNRRSLDAAAKFPGALRAYCVINPNYPEAAAEELRGYERHAGLYLGLKLHPEAHKKALSDPGYESALEFADEKKLPVLIHTWGESPFCGEQEVRAAAKKYRRAVLILGHSVHGSWEEAAAMAAGFPNVFLDLCAVLDERAGILERFTAGAGSEKILFGTDFPWFSHHYYIGGVMAADITDEDRRNIFYRNAMKILGLARRAP